jgi:hypothetical protein
MYDRQGAFQAPFKQCGCAKLGGLPCREPIGAASRATDLVVPAQTGIHAVMVHRVVETRNNILLKRFFNKELISFRA